MPSLSLCGVTVQFPHDPYGCQLEYMTAVLKSIQRSQNALLESPTGTGKTLSLLCASLAWIQSHGSTSSRVVYTSRTHSQLSQVFRELRKTSYAGRVKSCILASRDQLCVNAEVMKLKSSQAKISACRRRIKRRTCSYYLKLETLTSKCLVDIEDLTKLGSSEGICPYLSACELARPSEPDKINENSSKQSLSSAKLILMPYNYILDRHIRQTHAGAQLGIGIEQLIFDEAHNIESVCEEIASTDLSFMDVDHALDEIDHLREFGYNLASESQIALSDVRYVLLRFKDELTKLKGNDLRSMDELKKIFGRCGIHGGVADQMDVLMSDPHLTGKEVALNRMIAFFGSFDEWMSATDNGEFGSFVFFISDSSESLNLIFGFDHLPTTRQLERTLHIWCLDASIVMRSINARSIIITSGTLTPIGSFASSLGIPFENCIQCSHSIESSQLLARVVPNGPDNQPLTCTYALRTNSRYLNSLGQCILNMLRFVPGGVLIFFSSYAAMDSILNAWSSTGLRFKLERSRPIFVEPRDKLELTAIMAAYNKAISDRGGAVLCAIARGKVSEGIDFADEAARAIVVTGLPYPPRKDHRIELKMKWLDHRRSKEQANLTSSEWYEQQAFRAVNQAIGRVIRHSRDYGAVLLCDSRFTSQHVQRNLPAWLVKWLAVSTKFGQVVGSLCRFFRIKRECVSSEEKIKIVEDLESGEEEIHRSPETDSTEVEIPVKIRVHKPVLKTIPNSISSGSSGSIFESVLEEARKRPQNRNVVLSAKRQKTSVSTDTNNETRERSCGFINEVIQILGGKNTDLYREFSQALKRCGSIKTAHWSGQMLH
ncbi:hypothetical protein ACOME3_004812 [Neoechinorhynchus agilis]